MNADRPFNASEHFFVGKPGAPSSSWWTTAKRESFTAMVVKEQLPRMQGSDLGRRGAVLATAREIGTSAQMKKKTARRRAL